ncbi:MAG: hypothetical protein DRP35_07045 [Candidatus Zixiibacteriota bacterium]|nr:MAG: hypothetical protein DRP35_07045 [candidate division Zixibacteria bacterium]
MLFFIVLLGLTFTSAFAGNFNKVGTSGAQELLIPIGARGSSMGGALTANTEGLESVFWNPAGLASMEGTEIMFSHIPYFADIDVNFGGFAKKFDEFGTLAFSAKVVSIGDIEETTTLEPEGTGTSFNPTMSIVGVSYAKVLTANVSFGATFTYINETIFDVKASGMAFDAGFIYNPRWRGVSFGMVIKNYGPTMKFDGPGFDRSYEEAGQRVVSPNATGFELPSFIKFGVAYDFMDNGPNFATVTGNFVSNNFSEDQWQGGFEYVYDSKYSIRGGYNYSSQEDYIYGLSFGAGLTYEVGESNVTFEYSWTETEFFDANQYFTAKINF